MDKIAIIGLGYVGLPLAVEFAKQLPTVGFDVLQSRVDELNSGYDRTQEITTQDLQLALSCQNFLISTNVGDMADCNIYIITVPTPVGKNNQPDLSLIIQASEILAPYLKQGDIVIYESTVYPGVTEEICAPVLASGSGLIFNQGFFCGYSPERINPGDKQHTISSIKKVTAGSTPEIGQRINALYQRIIKAGTHLAPTIKVAEAAKVIENAQRDINIAFVNELALIFNELGINTHDVLAAASTKWNFLPFTPGLVGGHCIGVDPYYLAHKAQEIGYYPEIILAGRRLNDQMGVYVANQVVKLMIKKHHKIDKANVLVLGITFKENCPDIRNSKVIDVIRELNKFNIQVDVFDPLANQQEVQDEYDIYLSDKSVLTRKENYDAIILAVAHNQFKNLKLRCRDMQVIYDIKGVLEDYDESL